MYRGINMPDLGNMLFSSLAFAFATAFVGFPNSAMAGMAKTRVLRMENPKRYKHHLNARFGRLGFKRVWREPTSPIAACAWGVLTTMPCVVGLTSIPRMSQRSERRSRRNVERMQRIRNDENKAAFFNLIKKERPAGEFGGRILVSKKDTFR
jgi:hypothetical protein